MQKITLFFSSFIKSLRKFTVWYGIWRYFSIIRHLKWFCNLEVCRWTQLLRVGRLPSTWRLSAPPAGKPSVTTPFLSSTSNLALLNVYGMPNVTNVAYVLSSVLWIHTGFITDPDPGSQTNADPCSSGTGSWPDFSVTKSEFLREKYT